MGRLRHVTIILHLRLITIITLHLRPITIIILHLHLITITLHLRYRLGIHPTTRTMVAITVMCGSWRAMNGRR